MTAMYFVLCIAIASAAACSYPGSPYSCNTCGGAQEYNAGQFYQPLINARSPVEYPAVLERSEPIVSTGYAPRQYASAVEYPSTGILERSEPIVSTAYAPRQYASTVEYPIGGVLERSEPAVSTAYAPRQYASAVEVAPSNYPRQTYKVSLDNCGAKPKPLPPINALTKKTAPIQGPTVTLPFNVPRPRTVSNKCKCVKTVVKPQVVQQLIVTPVVRKYVQTLSRPVYETINYSAEPVNCPNIECYC